MDFQKKIKLGETYAGISEAELARRLNTSPQALGQRLKTGKFTYAEMEAIAKALGAEFVCSFRFSDGSSV